MADLTGGRGNWVVALRPTGLMAGWLELHDLANPHDSVPEAADLKPQLTDLSKRAGTECSATLSRKTRRDCETTRPRCGRSSARHLPGPEEEGRRVLLYPAGRDHVGCYCGKADTCSGGGNDTYGNRIDSPYDTDGNLIDGHPSIAEYDYRAPIQLQYRALM